MDRHGGRRSVFRFRTRSTSLPLEGSRSRIDRRSDVHSLDLATRWRERLQDRTGGDNSYLDRVERR